MLLLPILGSIIPRGCDANCCHIDSATTLAPVRPCDSASPNLYVTQHSRQFSVTMQLLRDASPSFSSTFPIMLWRITRPVFLPYEPDNALKKKPYNNRNTWVLEFSKPRSHE